MSSDLDAGRYEIPAALFDQDARQPPRRRSSQWTTVEGRERSLVTWTRQHLIFRPMHEGARQVSAHLGERVDASGTVANENARIVRRGILEEEGASRRHFVDAGDP